MHFEIGSYALLTINITSYYIYPLYLICNIHINCCECRCSWILTQLRVSSLYIFSYPRTFCSVRNFQISGWMDRYASLFHYNFSAFTRVYYLSKYQFSSFASQETPQYSVGIISIMTWLLFLFICLEGSNSLPQDKRKGNIHKLTSVVPTPLIINNK